MPRKKNAIPADATIENEAPATPVEETAKPESKKRARKSAPKAPAAEKIDVDENGKITGLF